MSRFTYWLSSEFSTSACGINWSGYHEPLVASKHFVPESVNKTMGFWVSRSWMHWGKRGGELWTSWEVVFQYSYPTQGISNRLLHFLKCIYKPQCQKDQRRWGTNERLQVLKSMPGYLHVLTCFIWRYTMGKYSKLYLKFVATHKAAYPNIAKLVTQWCFRKFKPFFITKAQKQLVKCHSCVWKVGLCEVIHVDSLQNMVKWCNTNTYTLEEYVKMFCTSGICIPHIYGIHTQDIWNI